MGTNIVPIIQTGKLKFTDIISLVINSFKKFPSLKQLSPTYNLAT
jgi:hypothetical protein